MWRNTDSQTAVSAFGWSCPWAWGAEALCSRMLEKNVILTPGSQYDISGEENRHIRLSFLNLSDDKIEVGLKRIGDMIRAMLEEKFLTLP